MSLKIVFYSKLNLILLVLCNFNFYMKYICCYQSALVSLYFCTFFVQMDERVDTQWNYWAPCKFGFSDSAHSNKQKKTIYVSTLVSIILSWSGWTQRVDTRWNNRAPCKFGCELDSYVGRSQIWRGEAMYGRGHNLRLWLR